MNGNEDDAGMPNGPTFEAAPPMTAQDIADAKVRRDAAMTTKEPEKPTIDALSAKIALMRRFVEIYRAHAAHYSRQEDGLLSEAATHIANALEFSANALEAMLDEVGKLLASLREVAQEMPDPKVSKLR